MTAVSRIYLDKPSLTVIGKPSAKLAEQLQKETSDRLEEVKKRLGDEGLKQIEKKLKDAQKQNDLEVPSEMLSSFKIPDVAGIRWMGVKSAAAGSNPARYENDVQQYVSKDQADLPYFLQFERKLKSSLRHIHAKRCRN